jgi:hypothetical protein
MSDPRYNEPRRNDESRGYGLQRSDQARFWSWLGPLLGLVIGGIIGYGWGYGAGVEHQKQAQLNPPATTGSAPAPQPPPHNR